MTLKSKRPRVAAAFCRGCLDRGLTREECIYQESPAVQRSYIEQLRKRVRDLEQSQSNKASVSPKAVRIRSSVDASETGALEKYHSLQATCNVNDNSHVHAHEAESSDEVDTSRRDTTTELDRNSFAPPSLPNEGPAQQPLNPTGWSSTDLDGRLDSPTSFRDDQSMSSSYFGQLRNILETKESNCVEVDIFGLQSQKATNGRGECGPITQAEYCLPVRSTADNLLRIYWSEVHPFFPYVHRPSFQEQYDTLWERDAPMGSRLFHCMLNTVFALACQLNPSLRLEARKTASTSFFGRAKSLLQHDLFEPATLEDVQALLLMAQYLQNTKAATECWAVVGSAIRFLLGLRLHQESKSTQTMTQRDREMFHRIWHGCHLMDRMLSSILGLPTMLQTPSSRSVVPLPVPVDDEYLSTESQITNVQPTGQLSKLHFFRHAIILTDILADIATQYYASPTDRQSLEDVEHQTQKLPPHIFVVTYEHRLNALWSSLPSHLRTANSVQRPLQAEDERLFQYQAVVFRARFQYTRILLFRPVLAQHSFQVEGQGLKDIDGEELSVEQSATLRAAMICVTSAQEVIALTFRWLDYKANLLPALWNLGIVVHAAATVLLMARERPLLRATVGDESLEQSWKQAIMTLEKCESTSLSVRQWVEHLQHLRQTSIAHQVQMPQGQVPEPPTLTQQILGDEAIGSSLPALTDDFTFESSDLMGLEDLDWNFLNIPPLGGH